MTLKERLKQIRGKVAGIVVKTGVSMPAIFDSSTGLLKTGSSGRPSKPNSMKGKDENNDSLTAHHMTAWNQIRDSVNEALKKSTPADLLKIFKDEGVSPDAKVKNNFGAKDADFYSALATGLTGICWNPSNVFMGPLTGNRGDDPGAEVDFTYTKSGMLTGPSALAMLKDKLREAKSATDKELADVLNDVISDLGTTPNNDALKKLKKGIEEEILKRKNAKDEHDRTEKKRAKELDELEKKDPKSEKDLKRIEELQKIMGSRLDREINLKKGKIKDQEDTKKLYETYLENLNKKITEANLDKNQRTKHLETLKTQLENVQTNLVLLSSTEVSKDDILAIEKNIGELNISINEQEEQLVLLDKKIKELETEVKEIELNIKLNAKNKVDHATRLKELEDRKKNKTDIEIEALEKEEDNKKLAHLTERLEKHIVDQGVTEPRPYDKDDWELNPSGKKIQKIRTALAAKRNFLELRLKKFEATTFDKANDREALEKEVRALIKDWGKVYTSSKDQMDKLDKLTVRTTPQDALLTDYTKIITTHNAPDSFTKRLDTASETKQVALIKTKLTNLVVSKVKFLETLNQVKQLLATLKVLKPSATNQFNTAVAAMALTEVIIDKIEKKDKTALVDLVELAKVGEYATIHAELKLAAEAIT